MPLLKDSEEIVRAFVGNVEIVRAFKGEHLVFSLGVRLAALLAAQSGAEAAFYRYRGLVASTALTTGISGSAAELARARAYAAAVAALSGSSSALLVGKPRQLEGLIAVLSDSAGAMDVSHDKVLVGVSNALSGYLADLLAARPLAAAAAALSGSLAAYTRAAALASAAASLSGSSAAAQRAAGLAAIAHALSASTAALTVATPSAVTSIAAPHYTLSGTGASISVSGQVQLGDLIALWDYAYNSNTSGSGSGTPTMAVPSGFSTVANVSGASNSRAILSAKISDGTEATLSGMTGGNGQRKCVAVFRPNVPASALTVGASTISSGTNTAPTGGAIGSSAGPVPLVALAGFGSTGIIDPRTFSPAADGSISVAAGSNEAYLLYKIYDSSPADITIGMDDEGFRNALVGGYVSLQ